MRRFLDSPSDRWLRRIAADEAALPSAPPADAIELWEVEFAAAAATARRIEIERPHGLFAPPHSLGPRIEAADGHLRHAAWLLTVRPVEGLPPPVEAANEAVVRARAEIDRIEHTPGAMIAAGWVDGMESELALRMRAPGRAIDRAEQWARRAEHPSFDQELRAQAYAWFAATLTAADRLHDAIAVAQRVDLNTASPAIAASTLTILTGVSLSDPGGRTPVIDGLAQTIARRAELVPYGPSGLRGEHDGPPIEINRNLAAICTDVRKRNVLPDATAAALEASRWQALASAVTGRWREVVRHVSPFDAPPTVIVDFDRHGAPTAESQRRVAHLATDLELAAATLRSHGYHVPTRAEIDPTRGTGGADLIAYQVRFDPTPPKWQTPTDHAFGPQAPNLGLMAAKPEQLRVLADVQRRAIAAADRSRGI